MFKILSYILKVTSGITIIKKFFDYGAVLLLKMIYVKIKILEKAYDEKCEMI